mmetsp:Transcript_12080/g.32439  ORF Transcript_12080/g.32439 Transcript_12080/m.32439 type:complete len:301 (+) Transcript_12080:527-1429(+)
MPVHLHPVPRLEALLEAALTVPQRGALGEFGALLLPARHLEERVNEHGVQLDRLLLLLLVVLRLAVVRGEAGLVDVGEEHPLEGLLLGHQGGLGQAQLRKELLQVVRRTHQLTHLGRGRARDGRDLRLELRVVGSRLVRLAGGGAAPACHRPRGRVLREEGMGAVDGHHLDLALVLLGADELGLLLGLEELGHLLEGGALGVHGHTGGLGGLHVLLVDIARIQGQLVVSERGRHRVLEGLHQQVVHGQCGELGHRGGLQVGARGGGVRSVRGCSRGAVIACAVVLGGVSLRILSRTAHGG